MTPFPFKAGRRGPPALLRAGVTTAFALGLLALIATGSPVAGGVMMLASGACVAGALSWVRHRERQSVEVPDGSLWAGSATIRIRDALACPLFDTVTVRRPNRARRHPALGASGDAVVDADGLTWTASLAANLSGVKGSFTLPWSAVVKAQAAAVPAATPGSGAIALGFADGSTLDLAFAGNYRDFRAALTRLPRVLPGLAD
jgi:hypothetical protein